MHDSVPSLLQSLSEISVQQTCFLLPPPLNVYPYTSASVIVLILTFKNLIFKLIYIIMEHKFLDSVSTNI